MTQNPFSFNYTTLLQTSTYKNKKFDIKNAGFMRPAITFLNIQLSNSRVMEMKLSLTQNENNIRPFYIIGLFYFVKTIANTFLMC